MHYFQVRPDCDHSLPDLWCCRFAVVPSLPPASQPLKAPSSACLCAGREITTTSSGPWRVRWQPWWSDCDPTPATRRQPKPPASRAIRCTRSRLPPALGELTRGGVKAGNAETVRIIWSPDLPATGVEIFPWHIPGPANQDCAG